MLCGIVDDYVDKDNESNQLAVHQTANSEDSDIPCMYFEFCVVQYSTVVLYIAT